MSKSYTREYIQGFTIYIQINNSCIQLPFQPVNHREIEASYSYRSGFDEAVKVSVRKSEYINENEI